jgi:Tol biopolymer transport system component
MKHRYIIVLLCLFVLLGSCNPSYNIPEDAQPTEKKIKIFPDYTNIVIPPNIAPLNFMIRENGDKFVCRMTNGTEDLVSSSDNTGVIQFEMDEWRDFITKSKNKSLDIYIYKYLDGKWTVYPKYHIQVAEEQIDQYLSYRLIEPGYILYRLMGLYQRDLTTFEQTPIIENPRLTYVKDKTYCVNCHNYQNYSTKRMLFHARSAFGGTIIAENGHIEKLNTKNYSILGSCVYPSWHPTKNWLVFSSNKTGQVFHIVDKQKIEVLDHASDIVFYNADTHEISNVIKTHNELETFPAWTPSGDMIYYCEAKTNIIDSDADSVMDSKIIVDSKKLKYNIFRIPFNEKSMSFGEPELVFNSAAINKSASVPRISPDGKYLLFTLGDFGQFHIWHSSSDLYVKNLETNQVYPLKAANSNNVDSYHAWSSNGRWIVFSSRRDDGSFSRSYITYFDKKGQAHKAFVIPQEDPRSYIKLFKSFNVPEFTKDKVPYLPEQFEKVVKGPHTPVKYKEIRPRFRNINNEK